MKQILLILIILISTSLIAQEISTRQLHGKIDKEVTVNISIEYLVYLPADYDVENNEWPLVLFLHGAGERGEDLSFVKRNGPPMLVDKGKDFPFILISPQCPQGKRWDALSLTVLLDEIEKIYRVDTNRIYLTGLSLGGEDTWNLAFALPDRFAAIAPVCGRSGSYYLDACDIKNLPIWVFHGVKDDVVSISESERIVKALEDCGSDVRFTIYPEANHDAWTVTYNNEELYKWLLEHNLNENK